MTNLQTYQAQDHQNFNEAAWKCLEKVTGKNKSKLFDFVFIFDEILLNLDIKDAPYFIMLLQLWRFKKTNKIELIEMLIA